MDDTLIHRAAKGALVGGTAGLISHGPRGLLAGLLLGAAAGIALHEATGRGSPVVLTTEEALVQLRHARN